MIDELIRRKNFVRRQNTLQLGFTTVEGTAEERALVEPDTAPIQPPAPVRPAPLHEMSIDPLDDEIPF